MNTRPKVVAKRGERWTERC